MIKQKKWTEYPNKKIKKILKNEQIMYNIPDMPAAWVHLMEMVEWSLTLLLSNAMLINLFQCYYLQQMQTDYLIAHK
jgi:hypothetical protein